MGHLEGTLLQIGDRLNSIDRRLDCFEQAVSSRFDQLENSAAQRFSQMDQRFNWLTGILVGTWITTILTVLFHR